MSFFASLGAGLGFGGGWQLASHFVQPPRETAIGTETIGATTLTVMQRDAFGLAPHWKLYAIWDGVSDQVGYFGSWPELQAGIQVFGTYLRGGGTRTHFWEVVNLPQGAPIPDVPRPAVAAAVVDYPDTDPAYAQPVDLDADLH